MIAKLLFCSKQLSVIFVSFAFFTVCCKGPNALDSALQNSVLINYDHVANIRNIRGMHQQPGGVHIGPVSSRQDGLFAVFVICSIDVNGREIQNFNYDVSKFSVEIDGENFGPLQPNSVLIVGPPPVNDASNTPDVIKAISEVLQLGPNTQVFSHGLHASLNYRIWIYIPDGKVRNHGNEQLVLRYIGNPSIVKGTGNRPVNLLFNDEQTLPAACGPLRQGEGD